MNRPQTPQERTTDLRNDATGEGQVNPRPCDWEGCSTPREPRTIYCREHQRIMADYYRTPCWDCNGTGATPSGDDTGDNGYVQCETCKGKGVASE